MLMLLTVMGENAPPIGTANGVELSNRTGAPTDPVANWRKLVVTV